MSADGYDIKNLKDISYIPQATSRIDFHVDKDGKFYFYVDDKIVMVIGESWIAKIKRFFRHD